MINAGKERYGVWRKTYNQEDPAWGVRKGFLRK